MADSTSLRWADALWFLLIVALAAGARFWYLQSCVNNGTAANAPFAAQDPWPAAKVAKGAKLNGKDNPTTFDQIIHNLRKDDWYGGAGPLTPDDPDTGFPVVEHTAHVAPGYPWVIAQIYRFSNEDQVLSMVRWSQCVLGALAAGLYFLFARRAFRNLLVAMLAGLFCALHPLWIANVADLSDGVLVTFLLASALAFGARAGESGGAFSSLIFGLSLAGMSLVRAALLPFSIVGILWFLLRCRSVPRGWLCAVLAVLGFVNGVAAWSVKNYQRFQDFVPISDSAFVHLWAGNNDNATGGPLTEEQLRAGLSLNRQKEILAEKNQSKRYKMLAEDVLDYVKKNPAETVNNRISSGLSFYFGKSWVDHNVIGAGGQKSPAWQSYDPASKDKSKNGSNLPDWMKQNHILIVNGFLLGMLVLGLLGWRWTYNWRKQAGLAALATIWIPLPYLLAHAETLWGCRLPLDGVFLCYSSFAIVYMIPIVRGGIAKGPRRRREETERKE